MLDLCQNLLQPTQMHILHPMRVCCTVTGVNTKQNLKTKQNMK